LKISEVRKLAIKPLVAANRPDHPMGSTIIVSVLVYLGGVVSGFIVAILTILSKSNIENAQTIQRIAIRSDHEIEDLERGKRVIVDRKPLQDLAPELAQAVRLTRWYYLLGPLLGLPAKRDIEQVAPKFRDYIETRVAFGRSNPALGPEIRDLLRQRKGLF
jgi:hypothetical protein